MKILIAHNVYRKPGGEDIVAATEAQLLADRGHHVSWYVRHNRQLSEKTRIRDVAIGLKTVWAGDSFRALATLLRHEEPDVVHFHNTFPLISPAAYFACENAGIPVVQTLHNYRLICPGATLFRDGHTCEECVGRPVPWPSMIHACYRDSYLATGATAAMLATHRILRSWKSKVHCYIALSKFAQGMFVRGGLPPERIHVKPNTVHVVSAARKGPGDYALFVGRLAREKGVLELLSIWKRLAGPIPLVVAGDGPLRPEVAAVSATMGQSVELCGAVSHETVIALMQRARFLVFPSIWYEACPLSLLEAFACGLPVVAPNHGATREMIRDGNTGLHFRGGVDGNLAEKIDWAWNHPREIEAIGRAAREEYERKYTPEVNYESLIKIYREAIERQRSPAANCAAELAGADVDPE